LTLLRAGVRCEFLEVTSSHLFHVLDDLLVAVLQTADAVLARVISGYSKPHIAVVLA
jgi:hypothetical protein